MQCELLGVADAQHVQVLTDLLTGLSSHPGSQIHQQELTIKSQASPFTELKLLQQIPEGKAAGPSRYSACTNLLSVCESCLSAGLHTGGKSVMTAYL